MDQKQRGRKRKAEMGIEPLPATRIRCRKCAHTWEVPLEPPFTVPCPKCKVGNQLKGSSAPTAWGQVRVGRGGLLRLEIVGEREEGIEELGGGVVAA